MAGRSSQADNRGSDIFSFLASGKQKEFHTGKSALARQIRGHTATGGVINEYNTPPGAVYRSHIFTSAGTFQITALGSFGDTVDVLLVAGGGGGGCLLYTSPSPRDTERSRMPSSA